MENKNYISMVKVNDKNFVPKQCCGFTNPLTSNGESCIDDIELPCGGDCLNDCDNCIIQKIMNEYAHLTEQDNGRSYTF